MTHVGMIMTVVAALLLAASHLLDHRFTVWDRHLLVAGVVLMLLGFIGGRRQRDRRWRVRGGRCSVCGKRVHSGQIYCEEHHKEAIRRTQEEHNRGRTR